MAVSGGNYPHHMYPYLDLQEQAFSRIFWHAFPYLLHIYHNQTEQFFGLADKVSLMRITEKKETLNFWSYDVIVSVLVHGRVLRKGLNLQ